MRKLSVIGFYFLVLLQSCASQKTPPKKIYNKEFNWAITIPENFESLTPEQWAIMQNKGEEAIEKSTGQKIENNAKTIFIFKSDQLNYFASNYQPFDTVTDGDYRENCQNVNNILFQTFESQMPDAKLDSMSSTKKIDGLLFYVFTVKISLPNGFQLTSLLYSRLFNKKEFSVNIMYADNKKGEQMLNSWQNSKFTNE